MRYACFSSPVQKVRAAVNISFQGATSKPDVLFTDRGRGFYHPNSGSITQEWKQGVVEAGFSTFMGDNASRQPGSLQDILLHETAVSWLRKKLEQSTPKKCWEENRESYGRRLKRCCEEVNRDHDVQAVQKFWQASPPPGTETGRPLAVLTSFKKTLYL